MGRVLIVQPFVPAYRKPFFDGVVSALEKRGHECHVVTGTLRGKRAARGDAVTASWHIQHPGFSLKIQRRHFRYYGSLRDMKNADLAVVELASGALDSHLALLLRALKRVRRVAVWGHVGNYTGNRMKLLERLETWQLRWSDLVFAYTKAGVRSAVERGAKAENTLSLDNTVDLQRLMDAVARVAKEDSQEQPNFRTGKTLAYIGGLDESKRIDFLASALDRLWEADREIRLIVGGAGDQAALLTRAVTRGQVVMLGRVDEQEKARMGRLATAMLMPGRVGLVAAESFVLGLPIITVDHSHHAPEFAYLTPGIDSIVTADTVEDYADTILEILNSPERVHQLREAARRKSGWPSMQHMVQEFVHGCLQLLGDDLNDRRS